MSTLKITVKDTLLIDLDVKRFYLPGVVASATCPECGKVVERDLGQHYLSYPRANCVATLNFHHDDGQTCHEWSEPYILNVTVSPVCPSAGESDEKAGEK